MRKFLYFASAVAGAEAAVALVAGIANWNSSPTEAAVLLGIATTAIGIAVEIFSLATTPRNIKERWAAAIAVLLLAAGVAVVSNGVVETFAPGFLPVAGLIVASISVAAAGVAAVRKLTSP
ncbi:hypothetical protein MT355_20570 [Rathayibacter sp. VKM Ac-2929]|uniref:hypothetical protein n=1 Tax=Rathayibacter sp. VKM Ac-2929 TaxID=2929480 RepID=UPI001FB546D5|nr:hypothetical protein [Rathayibacter sp. VKM Ac-2929]MCJ1675668.1 hypothetical protein [Rathayibacter sp. VKM Ac-2929]